jgi:mRNA interferase MazF
VWLINLDPVLGREQAGQRPAVVISEDRFNQGPAELVVVVPLTTRDKHQPLHVALSPARDGVRVPSFAKCEDIRSISTRRLLSRWGQVSSPTLSSIEDRLRIVLGL